MNDGSDPATDEPLAAAPISNRRVLVILAVLGVAGGVLGSAFHSIGFGLGLLIGTAIAFVNYYWLKRSVKRLFQAARDGETPRYLAVRYFFRHVLLGLAVAVIYVAGIVPIGPLLLGLAGLAFAVMIEGLIRIFSTIFSDKEI